VRKSISIHFFFFYLPGNHHAERKNSSGNGIFAGKNMQRFKLKGSDWRDFHDQRGINFVDILVHRQ